MFPYIADLLSINLKGVLWTDWGISDHFEGHGCEDLVLARSALLLVVAAIWMLLLPASITEIVAILVASSIRSEESWGVICELAIEDYAAGYCLPFVETR